MRGLFSRLINSRGTRPWRGVLHGAWLGALCAVCVLASGCGMVAAASDSNAPTPTAQPTRGPVNTCGALRQMLALHDAAPTPTMPAGGHWTYTLNPLGPLPLQAIWHAGATMRFSFCTTRDQTSVDAQGQSERLTVQILGPFKTMADASQAAQALGAPTAMSTPVASIGAVAASAPTLTTTTLSATDMSTTLQLPSNPTTGLYIALTRVVQASANGAAEMREQSVGIIQVQAA